MLQVYVSNVSFISDVCLQLIHLGVAKVDLDVGLLSDEERELACEPWRRWLVSWWQRSTGG